jgi:hypothetical protein
MNEVFDNVDDIEISREFLAHALATALKTIQELHDEIRALHDIVGDHLTDVEAS